MCTVVETAEARTQNDVRNGHNACGSQQYWCKECGKRGVLEQEHTYAPEQKSKFCRPIPTNDPAYAAFNVPSESTVIR